MARPPNAPNKNKAFLLNRLQEMYGDDFHPIVQIAKNCVELQEKVDSIPDPEPDDNGVISPEDVANHAASKVIAIKTANNEWSRIAEYTEPKLKAIEIQADIDHSGDLHITWQTP